jgi:hypothetical protein
MDKCTVQGILKDNLGEILKRHKFPLYQRKALCQLSVCRTETLGAHAQYCEAGHLNGVWYNSCKNRSCPQCQSIAKEEWLQNTKNILLDCPHHHVIFTIPEALNDLWRYNRELMSNLLFKAVIDTLKQFAQDSRYLAAVPGLLMVLHTWGRNLSLHPHIHCVISHGGLNAKGEWVLPKKKSLYPQKPVTMVFRGKLLAYIRKAVLGDKLILPPSIDDCEIKTRINKLGRKAWVVHFCKRYEYAEGVAKYLSRYVKGGPFNNGQISMTRERQVLFRYQSHQTKRREKLVLSVEAFALRIVQHVALPNKPSVRYGGLYSSSMRSRLNEARLALGQSAVSDRESIDWQAYLSSHDALPTCKECGLPLSYSQEQDKNTLAA